MNIDLIRAEIPHIDRGYIHLNHAGVTAVSSRVMNGMLNAIEATAFGSLQSLYDGFKEFAACKSNLATLMGVDPANLAFTKNTAHGISIVADGFKWNEGDEVIFADCEYPANTYPWFAQADRGVVCKVVKTELNGTVPIDSYRAAITPRTRLIAVSWVQFSTGFRSDIAALTELAHQHKIRILVDVIQGLGALTIDLKALGVDFAATGSQKWLIGPMGVGGLYINPDALNDLRLVNMGSASVLEPQLFDPLGFKPKLNAQRYEEGTPNLAGIAGLNAALSMLLEAGPMEVELAIREVTEYAMERLTATGFQVLSPTTWEQRAGIVLFKHPVIPNEQILAALEESKVVAVARGGKVRFAPHFYTTAMDIDRAVAALPVG